MHIVALLRMPDHSGAPTRSKCPLRPRLEDNSSQVKRREKLGEVVARSCRVTAAFCCNVLAVTQLLRGLVPDVVAIAQSGIQQSRFGRQCAGETMQLWQMMTASDSDRCHSCLVVTKVLPIFGSCRVALPHRR